MAADTLNFPINNPALIPIAAKWRIGLFFSNGQIRKPFILIERLSDVRPNSLIFDKFGEGVLQLDRNYLPVLGE
jgi:hypothetical protein